jgi:hypothetical protein
MNLNAQPFTQVKLSSFDTDLGVTATSKGAGSFASYPVLWIAAAGKIEIEDMVGSASVVIDIKAGDTLLPIKVSKILSANTTIANTDIFLLT